LEEELTNRRLALQERRREEYERNVKKCRRQTTTTTTTTLVLVCGGPRSGGCRRKIYVDRERFYRKSYKIPSVIDLVLIRSVTDLEFRKKIAATVKMMIMTTARSAALTVQKDHHILK
jgi:hypothetical protein